MIDGEKFILKVPTSYGFDYFYQNHVENGDMVKYFQFTSFEMASTTQLKYRRASFYYQNTTDKTGGYAESIITVSNN